MERGHEQVETMLRTIREFTNQYIAPENACTSHFIVFAKLKELDNNLAQHMYLENDILLARAIKMEEELLPVLR
jgi:regulator of cell morphogenesis and NO signaling